MSEQDDFEAAFRDIEAQMEDDFMVVDTAEEEAYAEWLEFASMPDLLQALARVSSELERLGERLFPTSERGHELHSKHTAIKMQMNKRGT